MAAICLCDSSERTRRFCLHLCTSFLATFLCHGAMMASSAFSHDSLDVYGVHPFSVVQYSLGRFLQPGYMLLRGIVESGWWYGILFALFMGAAAFLICEILHIRSKAGICLSTALLITNHTMISAFAVYMRWVDVYALCLLLCAGGVWLLRERRFGWPAAVILFVVAQALYQPYAMVVVALSAFDILRLLLDGTSWKQIARRFLLDASAFLFSYLLYRLTASLVLRHLQLEALDDYNGLGAVGLPALKDISWLLPEAWNGFFHYLFATADAAPAAFLFRFAFLFAAVFCLIHLLILRRLPFAHVLISSLLFLAMPLILNLEQFICLEEGSHHALVIFTIHLGVLLPVMLAESEPGGEPEGIHRLLSCLKVLLLPAVLAAAVFCNFRFAANVYTDRAMRDRATLSFMTRVIARAEAVEGFDPQTMPVLFVGSPADSPSIAASAPEIYPTLGSSSAYLGVTYEQTLYLYLWNELGYPRLTPSEEQQELVLEDTVWEMPVYPAAGSCQLVDGCMIIKLSD